MTKRLQLLKAVYSLNMNRLVELRTSDPNYLDVAEKVTKLHRRIKRKPRVKSMQLSMMHDMVTNFYPDHYND